MGLAAESRHHGPATTAVRNAGLSARDGLAAREKNRENVPKSGKKLNKSKRVLPTRCLLLPYLLYSCYTRLSRALRDIAAESMRPHAGGESARLVMTSTPIHPAHQENPLVERLPDKCLGDHLPCVTL